jgi:hypothetical protein
MLKVLCSLLAGLLIGVSRAMYRYLMDIFSWGLVAWGSGRRFTN